MTAARRGVHSALNLLRAAASIPPRWDTLSLCAVVVA